ncbi:MAG TPA: hypothetical protein VIA06_21275 [Candidatus Dormibacteraeota bacterium]|jgi:membrane protein DedA with SNARE-associated domain|nr:hypothetical protein [Candidatus Dormibacteraeota bacterium]
MYWLGRLAGERALRRLAGGRRGAERLERATAEVRRHAPIMVIGGRYIPGAGRR